MSGPPWVSADEVFARVSFLQATRAIQRALGDGLDPADDLLRGIHDVANGQLLLMPSQAAEFVGVKVSSVAPANPALGLERIQGVYLLMDAATLTPVALLDGTALTTLRTPAVSAAVADHLAPDAIDHLVVFGSGPQARAHIAAMRGIREIGRVTIVGRNTDRAVALAAEVARTDARAGGGAGVRACAGTSDTVRDAQLIVCATTSRQPLFDGSLVSPDCCVVAVGSHEPDARELDTALIRRAQVVVEDAATALRENGDVVIPVAEGALDSGALVPMRRIVTGETPVTRDRPRVFTSSGMSWEDLVVASAVYRAGALAG